MIRQYVFMAILTGRLRNSISFPFVYVNCHSRRYYIDTLYHVLYNTNLYPGVAATSVGLLAVVHDIS